jgi:hypothetical protein
MLTSKSQITSKEKRKEQKEVQYPFFSVTP